MSQPPQLDYRNQDLRNRSFKNKDLAGADFSSAAIQGCDFSGARLTGVNFQRVRIGKSYKQILTSAAGAGAVIAAVVAATITVAIFAGYIAHDAIFAFGRGAIFDGFVYTGLSVLGLGFDFYVFRGLSKTIRKTLGTDFEVANLTSANFSRASIQNADFSNATLSFVNWTSASFGSDCKFPKSFDNKISSLCTSRNGRNQSYCHANLKNLHLVEVILAGANLAEADLSGSKLNYANLEGANLCDVQASSTDFSSAVLTGSCIQYWGINAATRFTDVRCDYIYLEPDQQERRPASGIFQPGDFAKLVHQFTDTLDFLFRNGIEPQAFDVALRNLLTEYENAGLSLQAVVDVGDGDRLVKLAVANPTADKAPMHAQFTHDYEAMQQQLEAARAETQALQQNLAYAEGQLTVYREQSVFLQGFVYHQTDRFSRPSFNAPNSQFKGDVMPDNSNANAVRFGDVQGDIIGIAGGDNIGVVAGKDITGAAGGDISGTLTLTLGQLEATKDPEALKLADLLQQLKAAIEGKDAGLDAKDKEKALKHLDAIAKLGSDRTNPDLLERAGDALDALPTIVKRGNGLLEFSEKYLPTITAGIKTVLAAWGISL